MPTLESESRSKEPGHETSNQYPPVVHILDKGAILQPKPPHAQTQVLQGVGHAAAPQPPHALHATQPQHTLSHTSI